MGWAGLSSTGISRPHLRRKGATLVHLLEKANRGSATAPGRPSEMLFSSRDAVHCAVKLVPVTFAFVTVTFWLNGVIVNPPLLGVTV